MFKGLVFVCVSERLAEGRMCSCQQADAGERNRVKLKRCRSDEERDAAALLVNLFSSLLMEEETELQSELQ